LNRPATSKETESVINPLPTREVEDQIDGLIGKFHQVFKKEYQLFSDTFKNRNECIQTHFMSLILP
jgi:hypothetical protein